MKTKERNKIILSAKGRARFAGEKEYFWRDFLRSHEKVFLEEIGFGPSLGKEKS